MYFWGNVNCVNCSNVVTFRACTGWNEGKVANKSHWLSIRVTRVVAYRVGAMVTLLRSSESEKTRKAAPHKH